MYNIQQGELFSFEELLEMSVEQKYVAILEHLPMERILRSVAKKSVLGRAESLNTRAMVYSLIIGKIERIRYTKDLIGRLRTHVEFRKMCRFTDSDRIPSEAAYSRLAKKLEQTGVLQTVMDILVDRAIAAEWISGSALAMDGSHIECFDRNPHLDKKKNGTPSTDATLNDQSLVSTETVTAAKPSKPKRSKRGRVPKAEEAAWQEQVQAYKASLSWFERDVSDMLDASYDELIRDMPTEPGIGAKGDVRGKGTTKYWYGYRYHTVVDTASQYIVTGEICSANVSEQRVAIVMLKRIKERFSALKILHVLADKGYDSEPVYLQIRRLGSLPLIPLIHRSPLPEGADRYFRPLCGQGHPYRYDSYDAKQKTVKYTRPKECKTCSLAGDECQRVHKFRIDEDVRRYCAPGRGSKKFAELFKQRVAVERVFAYLKLYFNLDMTRKLKKRAFVDYHLSCLTYNLCKYSLDHLNRSIRELNQVA
ncbi:transposase [Paenibacillus ferrarius]|uniref:transposase n=1 Tax=Paenibacillus ferrarius TaxID=1469647 RepID=UPI003D2E626F